MKNFFKAALLSGALGATLAMSTAPAQAGMGDMYIGETLIFAGSFCPAGSLEANGQSLPVSDFEALFSLLGTTFGGDGISSFDLPDLRGRVPVHVGTGPGLTTRILGQEGGTETVTISLAQMAQHNHYVGATSVPATTNMAGGNLLSSDPGGPNKATPDQTASLLFKPDQIGSTGNSIPIANLQPTIGIRYCIITNGAYPIQD